MGKRSKRAEAQNKARQQLSWALVVVLVALMAVAFGYSIWECAVSAHRVSVHRHIHQEQLRLGGGAPRKPRPPSNWLRRTAIRIFSPLAPRALSRSR
jgi:hypothetical protein